MPVGAPLVGENSAGGSSRASAQNAPPGPDTGAAGRGQLITSALAGRLLMVSPERIRQLSKEGWIEKQGRDQFFLVDVVQGYPLTLLYALVCFRHGPQSSPAPV